MCIIIGASGRVGSQLIHHLTKSGITAIAVARDPDRIADKNIQVRKADLLDTGQVIEAFRGTTTAFLITPENPVTEDIMGDTRIILNNYREAVEANHIRRVVLLSCVGAHVEGNTGNILLSRLLEDTFSDADIEKVIIRPSYYYSNWLGYMETAEQQGVLPTFFPEKLKIEMHSPHDLAAFVAGVMNSPSNQEKKQLYELAGPVKLSPADVATAFSSLLKKEVTAQSISPDQWKETLLSVGFTENTAVNLIDMTQAVIDGLAAPEFPEKVIRLTTTIGDYLKEV